MKLGRRDSLKKKNPTKKPKFFSSDHQPQQDDPFVIHAAAGCPKTRWRPHEVWRCWAGEAEFFLFQRGNSSRVGWHRTRFWKVNKRTQKSADWNCAHPLFNRFGEDYSYMISYCNMQFRFSSSLHLFNGHFRIFRRQTFVFFFRASNNKSKRYDRILWNKMVSLIYFIPSIPAESLIFHLERFWWAKSSIFVVASSVRWVWMGHEVGSTP